MHCITVAPLVRFRCFCFAGGFIPRARPGIRSFIAPIFCFLLATCFITAPLATADSYVVWDYPLTVLPEGWIIDGWQSGGDWWTFNSSGAYGHCSTDGVEHPSADASLISQDDIIVVPPQLCDSLVIEAQSSYTFTQSPTHASTSVSVLMKTDSGGWVVQWIDTGPGQSSEPLRVVCTPACGNTLRFRFMVEASIYASGYGAGTSWNLSDMTITLYGDFLSLEPSTWARIKALF